MCECCTHSEYFDEHDEQDQELLYERAMEIVEANHNNAIFDDDHDEEAEFDY